MVADIIVKPDFPFYIILIGTVEPILAMIAVSDLKTAKRRILELVKKEVLRLS